jgi:hypothetical protein
MMLEKPNAAVLLAVTSFISSSGGRFSVYRGGPRSLEDRGITLIISVRKLSKIDRVNSIKTSNNRANSVSLNPVIIRPCCRPKSI